MLDKNINFEKFVNQIKPLILECFESPSKKNKIQEDMLMTRFTSIEKEIYYKIHRGSMIHGKIWEIVFFNWDDWKKIGGMDGKSENLKTLIELKNKPTTLNDASSKGTFKKIEKLKKKYPNYQFIIGFVNNDLTRDTMNQLKGVRILGGDALFKFVFQEHSKEIQKRIKKIVNEKESSKTF